MFHAFLNKAIAFGKIKIVSRQPILKYNSVYTCNIYYIYTYNNVSSYTSTILNSKILVHVIYREFWKMQVPTLGGYWYFLKTTINSGTNVNKWVTRFIQKTRLLCLNKPVKKHQFGIPLPRLRKKNVFVMYPSIFTSCTNFFKKSSREN